MNPFKKNPASKEGKVPAELQLLEVAIPQSLYDTLALIVRTSSRYTPIDSGMSKYINFGPLYPQMDTAENLTRLTMITAYGTYELKPYPDTDLCESTIEQVTERKTVEVQVDKQVFRYKK